MKTTVVAALAALLTVAHVAVAAATGSATVASPVDDEVARATTEARALVATMQNNARIAREALELARHRQRQAPVRCADEDTRLFPGRFVPIRGPHGHLAALMGVWQGPSDRDEALFVLG